MKCTCYPYTPSSRAGFIISPLALIDLHCHLLPGVDDGPETTAQSMDMARAVLAAGIDTAVATTHALDANSVPERARLENLAQSIEQATGLKIVVGYELHILALAEGLDPSGYTIGNSRFVLVEFSLVNKLETGKEYLFDMMRAGLKPILAHPERYHYADSRCLRELRAEGVMLQINSRSFAGDYGKPVKNKAWDLVKQGLVDFIASDAHRAQHYETHRSALKQLRNKGVPVDLLQPISIIQQVLKGEQT